ncbi:12095_t:CDS:2 [Acaulospora colombiana]|uniref:12095_t:CDS:1 n=1 Tax=Acaulospora colombiana TaxID=27376 RepID=A0ACA9LJC3_9GLOM|nr:12095_t:CDS:2 [Acaulospora colombiana]
MDVDEFDDLYEIFDFEEDTIMNDEAFCDMFLDKFTRKHLETFQIKDEDAKKNECDKDRLNFSPPPSDFEFLTDDTLDIGGNNDNNQRSKLSEDDYLPSESQSSVSFEKENHTWFSPEKKKSDTLRRMPTPITFEDDLISLGGNRQEKVLSEKHNIHFNVPPLVSISERRSGTVASHIYSKKKNPDGSIFSHVATEDLGSPNRSVFSRVYFKNEQNTNCNVLSRVYFKDKRITAHCGVISRVNFKSSSPGPLTKSCGTGHAATRFSPLIEIDNKEVNTGVPLNAWSHPVYIILYRHSSINLYTVIFHLAHLYKKKKCMNESLVFQNISKGDLEEKSSIILHLQELKIGSFTNDFPCAIELNPNTHTINFVNPEVKDEKVEDYFRLNIHIKGVENYLRDGYEIEMGLKKQIRRWIIPVQNVIGMDEVKLSVDSTDGIIKAESINMVVSDREELRNLKDLDNMFREIQNSAAEPVTIVNIPVAKFPILVNYERKRIPFWLPSNTSLTEFLQLMQQKFNDPTIRQPFSCAVNGINGILGVYDERDWEACKTMIMEDWDEFDEKDKDEIALEVYIERKNYKKY